MPWGILQMWGGDTTGQVLKNPVYPISACKIIDRQVGSPNFFVKMYQAINKKQKNNQNCPLLGLCAGNPTVAGGFPAQRASHARACHAIISNKWIHIKTYLMAIEMNIFPVVFSVQ